MAGPGDDFWEFSVALYGRSGVSEACLALQDESGLDVNVVLFCVWHAWSGRGIMPAALVAAAHALSCDYGDAVVAPLRAARRALKWVELGSPQADDTARRLRRDVKEAELMAERAEQQALASFAGDGAGETASSRECACSNLAAYSEFAGVPINPNTDPRVAVIVDAAFAPG